VRREWYIGQERERKILQLFLYLYLYLYLCALALAHVCVCSHHSFCICICICICALALALAHVCVCLTPLRYTDPHFRSANGAPSVMVRAVRWVGGYITHNPKRHMMYDMLMVVCEQTENVSFADQYTVRPGEEHIPPQKGWILRPYHSTVDRPFTVRCVSGSGSVV
jgi:hypothetical protein